MIVRFLTAAFLLIFISTNAHTQLVRGYGLKIGAVAANQTWGYSFPVSFPTETRWGFDAGMFIEVLDLPSFTVLMELHYVQKGFSSTLVVTTPSTPDGELRSIRPRAEYLALPLLFKVRFDAGVVSPYVDGGPRFDFLLSTEGDVVSLVYDNLKNIDAGASFGLGVEVPMDLGRHALVEFRLSPTFTDAFTSNMVTVRNRSMEFLAGVCF